MKTKNFSMRHKFGAFLLKKLKDYYDSYDDLYKNLNDLREDYRISAIMGSGPFYYLF